MNAYASDTCKRPSHYGMKRYIGKKGGRVEYTLPSIGWGFDMKKTWYDKWKDVVHGRQSSGMVAPNDDLLNYIGSGRRWWGEDDKQEARLFIPGGGGAQSTRSLCNMPVIVKYTCWEYMPHERTIKTGILGYGWEYMPHCKRCID
jgi:hypothetical protein